ncbi:MAG TPA: GNAT family N-acetyltransferase [Spirochaetota bacterium]|nr:GNAT family N-acetyltransferase [Spirochaetota bacterium]
MTLHKKLHQGTDKYMIREATHNDIETIARIIVAAWQTAYEGIIDPSFPPSMKEDKFIEIFTDIFENRKEIVFVYEEHNTVLGFVSGVEHCGKYDCEIKGLYVDPEYQGQGIGSSLLNEMKQYFLDNNKLSLIIWTLHGVKNNAFYKKHGGVIREYRDLEIGEEVYEGAGFVFSL